jgi:di/tricarboxylate transporter
LKLPSALLRPTEIPILIAIAFWLSGGFIRSGLGARIAYSIVALFGKTTLVSACGGDALHCINRSCGVWLPATAALSSLLFLLLQGLTYSLVAAEALLAPAIPSVAARAGGLFLPLAKALCLACGACQLLTTTCTAF